MSVINTNIQAIAAARNLNRSQELLGRTLNRLSSGSKIVNPSDDAAGLAVSEKLDAQNMRVKAATTNVQNAISYTQTTDGFMSGMTKILARMSELALLSKDVTKNSTDVALYQKEFTALQDQLRQTIGGTVAQIGGKTDIDPPLGQFNGITLFGNDSTNTLSSGGSSSSSTTTMFGAPTITAATYTPGAGMSVGSGVTIGGNATFGSTVAIGDGSTVDGDVGNTVTVGKNAYIGTGATIGDNVTIGDGAYIEAGVTVAPGTVIQPGAIILFADNPSVSGTVASNVQQATVTAGAYTAGAGTSLGSGVVVGAGAAIGTSGTIGANTQIGTDAALGNSVTVGTGSYISHDAVIGNNVKIGTNVFIAPGVTIADGVTIPDGTAIVSNVSSSATFPTAPVSSGNGLTVTVGQAVGQTMTIPQINLRDGAMGKIIHQETDGSYSLSLASSSVIADLTSGIQDVATERASLGASQSRLELASNTLQVEYENLQSAISRIRDVDVAEESTQYARYNILVQSGTAMLAQANQTPQAVLKLLNS